MFFAKLIGKHLRWNLLLINLKSTGLQLYQKRGSSAVIFLRILRNSLEPLFHGKRSSDCFCYAKFNLGHWSTSLVPMLHFIQKAADVKYGKTLKLKKKLARNWSTSHCVKSVRMQSVFWSVFSHNSKRIQSFTRIWTLSKKYL